MLITFPNKPKIVKQENNKALFEIEGCYPGYGITLGNALRRALLSSLDGAAITSVKVEGIQHEFSVIPGVKENIIDIVLNLKQVRFKLYSDEPVKLVLRAKGEKEVKAKDIEANADVEIITNDAHIATLTDKKAELKMEIEISRGLGYESVEVRKKERLEIGKISIDAIYSPVTRVNLEVENMRVGDRTDFNLLRLEIETDGSITPSQALKKASQILVNHFEIIADLEDEQDKANAKKKAGTTKKAEMSDEVPELTKINVEDLKLSARTISSLAEAGIKTVGGLIKKREGDVSELKGLGDKGIKEIKKALKKFGLELKE